MPSNLIAAGSLIDSFNVDSTNIVIGIKASAIALGVPTVGSVPIVQADNTVRWSSSGRISISVDGVVVPPTNGIVDFQDNTSAQFNKILFTNLASNIISAQVDPLTPGVYNEITINNRAGNRGITLDYPDDATTSYSLLWPGTQGTSNTFLRNDGLGTLSWQTVVTSLKIGAQPAIYGDVVLAAGSNVTLTQVGNTVTIASTGGGGGGITTVTSSLNALTFTNPTTAPILTVQNSTSPSTQFLRGDGTWAVPSGGASGLTSIGMTVPSPLAVSPATLTANGVFAVTWGNGQIPTLNLGTGTASNSNFLRGDSSWQPVLTSIKTSSQPIITGDVTLAAGNNISLAQSGSTITITGTGGGGGGTVTSVTSALSAFTFTNSTINPALTAQNVTSATTQFLRGDGTWAVPAGGSGGGTVNQVLANNGITVSPTTSGAATYTVGLLGNTVFSATGAPGTVAGARTGDIYLQLGDRGATQPWYGILSTYKYNGTSWDNYAQAGVAIGQSTPFTPLPGSLTQVPYYGIYWQHDGDSTKRFASLWRREALNGVQADYVQYYPPSLDTVCGSGGLASSAVTTRQVNVGILQVAGNGTTDSKLDILSSTTGSYNSILIANVTSGSDLVLRLAMPSTGSIANKYRFTAVGQLSPIPSAGQDFVIDIGIDTRVIRLFGESGFLGGGTGGNGNSADTAISIQFENPINFNTNRMGGVNANVNDVLSYNGTTWIPRPVSGGGGTGTVTSVTSSLNAFTFTNQTINPVLTAQNVTSASTQFLRGDGTWAVPAGGSGGVSQVTLTVPTGFAVSGSPGTGNVALGITYSGQIPVANLGTGTASNANYLRGDGTWQPAVASVAKQGGTARTGAIQFIQGANVTITDNGDGTFTFASTGGGGGGSFSSVTAVWTDANSATKDAYTGPGNVNVQGITIRLVATSDPGSSLTATISLNAVNLTNTYAVTGPFPNYTITVPSADLSSNSAETAASVTVGIRIGTQFNLSANNLLNRQPVPFTATLTAVYTPSVLPYYTTLASLRYAYNWTGDYTFLGGSIQLTGATDTIAASAESATVLNNPINGGFISGLVRGVGQYGAGNTEITLTGSVSAATTYVPAFFAQTATSTPPSFTSNSSQTTGGAQGSTINYPLATARTQYNWICTQRPLSSLILVTPIGSSVLVPDVTGATQNISGQTFNVYGWTLLSTVSASVLQVN